MTVVLSSLPPLDTDSGQRLPLPVRHRRGHHVLLHGGPQAPQGLTGGPPVAGGEDEPGGAEPAAGEALWGWPWGSAGLEPGFGACRKGVDPVAVGTPGLRVNSFSLEVSLCVIPLPAPSATPPWADAHLLCSQGSSPCGGVGVGDPSPGLGGPCV